MIQLNMKKGQHILYFTNTVLLNINFCQSFINTRHLKVISKLNFK